MYVFWISWKWFWVDDLNLNELLSWFFKNYNLDFLCINQDIILFDLLCLFLPFTKENISFGIDDLKFLLNIFYYLISNDSTCYLLKGSIIEIMILNSRNKNLIFSLCESRSLTFYSQMISYILLKRIFV